MVHPQCRGYIHRTVFIFNSLQQHSFDMRTQLQIFTHSATDLLNNPKLCTKLHILSSKTLCALSCRGRPCTQLGLKLPYKPSTHSAAEVVHSHIWDLTLNPKIGLSSFTSNHHTSKSLKILTLLLYKSAYLYQCTITIP